MNLNFRELLPDDFDPSSRVWIYQSSRIFSISEAIQIEDLLKEFVERWNSHGTPVKGYGNLFFGQFIVLFADESSSGVSGCSTDSSVRLIKDIEQLYQVNLFDRQLLAFVVKEKIQLIPMQQLQYAISNNFIQADTPYFNNMVQNLDQLIKSWIIPVKDSWLNNRFSFALSHASDA
ncbi:MAG: hypothetical protein ABI687_12355 [Flavitalea sp.]